MRQPNYGFEPSGALRDRLADQHCKLLANCLAQAQALLQGKTAMRAAQEKAPTANPDLPADTLARHRSFPGNRPSTLFMLERLDPRTLGALIALYEQRVFVSGGHLGINSFDQWGVELGKALCNQLLPRWRTGDTRAWMDRLRRPCVGRGATDDGACPSGRFRLGAVLFRWRPGHVGPGVAGQGDDARGASAGPWWIVFSPTEATGVCSTKGLIDAPELARRHSSALGCTEQEVLGSGWRLRPTNCKRSPKVLELLRALKAAGHRLSYLSNMPAPLAARLKARNPLDDWFESGVFSSHVQVCKPDPRIFRWRSAYQTEPANCC